MDFSQLLILAQALEYILTYSSAKHNQFHATLLCFYLLHAARVADGQDGGCDGCLVNPILT